MSIILDVKAPSVGSMAIRMKQFSERHLPFALSLAMNRAAKDAVDAGRRNLGSVFELRSGTLARTFGPFGRMGDITRGWSNRSQWPALRVTLHSTAHAMALQEEGGDKPFRGIKDGARGTSGQRARHVWIPTKYLPRTGRRIEQRFQPARIRKRLEATRRGRNATNAVFQQGNKVFVREQGSAQARPLYILHQRAVVPPRLGFEQVIQRTYNAKLYPRFVQAMNHAIRTEKPK